MTTTAARLKAQAAAAKEAARAAASQADELAAAARQAEREEQQAAERAANEAFENRLYEEGQALAGLNRAQHDAVYALAWQQGHASGYDEVEGHYGELAELARKVIEAN